MTRSILISGGAGFIGSNLARHYLFQGAFVRVLDDLSRPGVEHNLRMLRALGGDFEFIRGSVRDRKMMHSAVSGVAEVYHLAAQVAVTSSVADPRNDFETNLLGTFNVLEAARQAARPPFLLFTSTNKVYGELAGVPLLEERHRYRFADRDAIDESQSLDFQSPYGCSKGAAEQYVRDHARVYGLPAVVFRMSCIAGPQQFGNEDQGWLAHFLYAALDRRNITIYGNGKQVRDILHVSDLIAAMEAAYQNRDFTSGQIFNIGGGLHNSGSLLDVLSEIEALAGHSVELDWESPRAGDQRVFIANTAKFQHATGWRPTRSVQHTMQDILNWRKENDALFRRPTRMGTANSAA
jgi:CDP-paratose 2-epimerase